MTDNGIVEYSSTAAQTLSGNISGSGALTKDTGTSSVLTLSGNNNYSGVTTISAGTLQFAKPASLYNGTTASWTAANIKVGSGATFAINIGGASDFTTGNVTTLLTNLDGAVSSNGLMSGSSIGFDTTNATATVTLSNVIANTTGTGGGSVGVVKLGANTLALTNTNTFTGETTISAGTLQIGSAGSLGSGSYAADIADNGTFKYSSSANQRCPATSAAPALLIKDTGTSSTLTLSGINTFSGGTTINAGTLMANSTNTTSGSTGTGLVTVNSGGTLGSSNGQIRGSITVNSGGIITAGTSAGSPTTGAPAKLTANAASKTTTFASGGNYDLKINNATGTAGTNWDELVLNSLSVTATTGSQFNVKIFGLTSGNVAGAVPNFNNTTNYSWVIATLAGTSKTTLDGFLASLKLDTSGFTNNNSLATHGTFSLGDQVDGSGSDLVLNYSATPEVSSLFLLGIGVGGLAMRRRRPKKIGLSPIGMLLGQLSGGETLSAPE